MDKAELVTFDPFQGIGSQNPGLRLTQKELGDFKRL
jgi:hypothetical protein